LIKILVNPGTYGRTARTSDLACDLRHQIGMNDLAHQSQTDEKATVLVVDDERGPRESLRMILRPTYEVFCARDGLEALEILRSQSIDLVTLDLNMPGIQGEEIMRTIRREFPGVELIVITGYGTLENAAEAVRYGVSDYLQKPFDVVQVSASVYRALSRRRGRSRLVGFLETLGEVVGLESQVAEILDHVERDPRVNRRVAELVTEMGRSAEFQQEKGERVRTMDFLEVLADTVESQCEFMRGHARRTAYYAGLLADRLGLSTRDQEQIRIAGFLHDIGKIGVPTDLLMRPSSLSAKERRLIERHPEIGARLVEPLGIATEIAAVIRHHHEWWDGRGYPDGLYGEQIPLFARIVAVADAYDGMSSSRPYRPALSPEEVRGEFRRGAGAQFDPALVKEFLLALESGDPALQIVADAFSAPAVRGAPLHGGPGDAAASQGALR
jgi:putative nucleotidyltransferase with HDIG domain